MSKKTGIWIDHSKAFIVSLDENREKVTTIESKAGRKVRLSGGSRTKTPYAPQDVASESRRYRKYMQNLKHYYEKVIRKVGDSEALYVFGPGHAKTELKKHLESYKHTSPPVLMLESADKMTDAQLIAKVKNFFQHQPKSAMRPKA
jgi:stalled ribosome rescue protein Dom34